MYRKLCQLLVLLLIFLPGLSHSMDIWQKYSKLSKLSAEFSQTKELKNIGVTLKSKGTISFKRPDYFEWTVLKPKNFVFLFKDNTITLMEEGKFLKNTDSANFDKKMLEAINHLKAWMMIDQKFIEANYDIKNVSKNIYEFTPKGDLKLFKNILIEMGKDYPIKKISLTEYSNDVMVIEFTKTKLTYEN